MVSGTSIVTYSSAEEARKKAETLVEKLGCRVKVRGNILIVPGFDLSDREDLDVEYVEDDVASEEGDIVLGELAPPGLVAAPTKSAGQPVLVFIKQERRINLATFDSVGAQWIVEGESYPKQDVERALLPERARADELAAAAVAWSLNLGWDEGSRKPALVRAQEACQLIHRGDAAREVRRSWPPMLTDSTGDVTLATSLLGQLEEGGKRPVLTTEGVLLRYNPDLGVFEGMSDVEKRLADLNGIHWVRWYRGKWVPGPISLGDRKLTETGRALATLTEDAEGLAHAVPGLAFTSGFLQATADGIALRPHSPEHRARHSTGVPWDPDAEAPEWQAHLQRHAGGPESGDLLAELVGLALIGQAVCFDMALVLSGPGGTGKSTTVDATKGLFPTGAVSAIPPQALTDSGRGQYAVASLAGKLLNAVEELPAAAVRDSAAFKAVVSGGDVQGRHPYGRPFSVRPRALHVFATNELPGVGDTSTGFWRRLAVIPFEVPMEQPRGEALATFDRERAGMYGWALRGAQRALRRGRLILPEVSRRTTETWRNEGESVATFMNGCCLLDEGPEVSASGGLYQLYRGFALAAGYRPVTLTAFGRRLSNLLPDRKTRDARNRVAYRGVSILPIEAWRVRPDERTYPVWPQTVHCASKEKLAGAGHGLALVEADNPPDGNAG